MNAGLPRLLEMDSSFPEIPGLLRLLEPPGSCRQTLRDRLLDRSYDKPFIADVGARRSLHFDLDAVQSVMHVESPDRLSLAYTRKMMSFLLFNLSPGRILFLGLGGGSLAKFCYRRLPDTAITTVEVNPLVIALRREFRIPTDDHRFRVVRADAADYLARLDRTKDVIVADACDRKGIAPGLDTLKFYQDVHRHLSEGGVFVTNLCSDPESWAGHLLKIRTVFGEEFMTMQVQPDGNVILFAFKDSHPVIDWAQLAPAAMSLKRRLGVNFPRYLRRLALNCEVRRSWRSFHPVDALAIRSVRH